MYQFINPPPLLPKFSKSSDPNTHFSLDNSLLIKNEYNTNTRYTYLCTKSVQKHRHSTMNK